MNPFLVWLAVAVFIAGCALVCIGAIRHEPWRGDAPE